MYNNSVKTSVGSATGTTGTMRGWGWEKKWSTRSQRFYWYNRSKNISVWSLVEVLDLK